MAESKYRDWITTDRLVLLQGWARDGLSDEQIAHNMGITGRTLYRWMAAEKEKKDSPCPICQALKNGKEVVDYIVENALMKQAVNGNVVAQIFWLKNRKPDKWRDRVEHEVRDDFLENAEQVLVKVTRAAEEDANARYNSDAKTS